MNKVTRGRGLLEGFLAKKRAAKANSLISDNLRQGKILDIGCGSYPYFLVSTSFKEKYGIDPSLTDLSLKEISLTKIDISSKQLPFNDNMFDVVTMLAVFEHIENDRLSFVLSQVNRVLKKDGVLIITTPSPWSDKLLHGMAKVGLISEVEIHEHKSHYKSSNIVEKIAMSGFENNEIKIGYFEIGFNMWFCARK